jgi:hypothetical protein
MDKLSVNLIISIFLYPNKKIFINGYINKDHVNIIINKDPISRNK